MLCIKCYLYGKCHHCVTECEVFISRMPARISNISDKLNVLDKPGLWHALIGN